VSDLRKAAERVLKTWDKWKGGPFEYEMEELRQALAKREWVGLTDEDLTQFTDEFYKGAVWAEAKLKDRNA
jgi:hypothetical protein